MKLKFRKLQTGSETITVEFGNRTETYSKESFSDLLENGIEFTEDDLGNKDIAGIQLKTNVNGLEKIQDFKNGVDFYIEVPKAITKLYAYEIVNGFGDFAYFYTFHSTLHIGDNLFGADYSSGWNLCFFNVTQIIDENTIDADFGNGYQYRAIRKSENDVLLV